MEAFQSYTYLIFPMHFELLITVSFAEVSLPCWFFAFLFILSAHSFIIQAVVFSAPNLDVGVPQGDHF